MTKARCRASRPRKRAVTFPTVARATVGKIPGGSRRRLERQARKGEKRERRPEGRRSFLLYVLRVLPAFSAEEETEAAEAQQGHRRRLGYGVEHDLANTCSIGVPEVLQVGETDS